MSLDAKQESLSIPDRVRDAVDVRDRLHCRVCGRFLGDRRAHHHVQFGGDQAGMGGRRRHAVDLIVTVCWLPGDGDCHAMVHSQKSYYQELLLEAISRRGLTVFQLERWRARQRINAQRGGS